MNMYDDVMKNADADSLQRLRDLWQKYDTMPNRGAILFPCNGGQITDGLRVVAGFTSLHVAKEALKSTGFVYLPDRKGWKAEPVRKAVRYSFDQFTNKR